MKISVKAFAYAVLASFVFWACEDIGTNANNSNSDPISCSLPQRTYISYDVYDGPDDPTIVIIVGNVKDWMDEQLASGGKEQKLIWIYSGAHLLGDPMERPTVSGTYDSITGKTEWFVNGKEVTYDELKELDEALRIEYIKLKEEQVNSYMASVHIPGEEIEIRHGGWKALMTAEDIVELTENNEGLAISFYTEPEEPPYEPDPTKPYKELGGNAGGFLATEWTNDANSLSCP